VFLSTVNAPRSGRIRAVKHRFLQIVLLRLALSLPIRGIAVSTTDRSRSAHLCYVAEAVTIIMIMIHLIT